MSSLLADDSNLDDLVGTLMSQLRASPPDWLATSAKDESTALAQNTFAELAASQKVPNFSAKTAEHWLQVAQTSQTAKEWYTKLQDEDVASDDGQVVVAIAGNKCDCTAEERMVPLKLGESFAANNGLLHFETSAKTGEGVREMFSAIVQKLPEPDAVDDGRVDIQVSKGGKKKKGCC